MLRIILNFGSALFFVVCTAQDFDPEKYLNGQWCDADEVECFKITSSDGLLIYETLTGDFRAGISITGYDEDTNTIHWEIIRTRKKTNHFKVLGKNKVEYDNNSRRVLMYRKK